MVVIIETEGKTSQEIKKEIYEAQENAKIKGWFSVTLKSITGISDGRLVLHLGRNYVEENTSGKW